MRAVALFWMLSSALVGAACAEPSAELVHDPSRLHRVDGELRTWGSGAGGWALREYRVDLVAGAFDETSSAAASDLAGTWWEDIQTWNRTGEFDAPAATPDGGRLYFTVYDEADGEVQDAIGLSERVGASWEARGIVVQSTGEAPETARAMDPAIVESSGASHLVFGSHAGGVFLAELDPASGRLKERPEETRTSEGSERFVLLASNPLTEEDSLGGIEAPYIHERDGRFHLFVNVGACCRGVDSTYRVLSGRADVVTGPYLDRDGVDMKDGGGTVFLDGGGRLLGPGHVGIGSDGAGDVVTYHYYDGDDDGISKLGARALNWTSDGWPEPGEARIGP